jgi:hypothetical protein
MYKLKWLILPLVMAALFATVIVQAESDKKIPSEQAAPSAVSADSKQAYRLVTDVLDGFGGKSESINYQMPVNSGGEPSGIGISGGTVYGINAGFVFASQIKRGDANANGVVDLGDAIYLLNYLFKNGLDPCPVETGDVNCNSIVDLGDVIYLLNFLFKGGPGPTC